MVQTSTGCGSAWDFDATVQEPHPSDDEWCAGACTIPQDTPRLGTQPLGFDDALAGTLPAWKDSGPVADDEGFPANHRVGVGKKSSELAVMVDLGGAGVGGEERQQQVCPLLPGAVMADVSWVAEHERMVTSLVPGYLQGP